MPTHFPFSIQLEIEIHFVGTKVKYLSYCARVHSCYAHPCHAPALDFSARRTARIPVKYISGLSLGKLKIFSINLPLTNQHAGF